MKKILEEEVKRVSLSRGEVWGIRRIARGFVGSLRGEGLRVEVGGSLAKGTLIRKEKQDVDIFVVFNSEGEIRKLDGVLKRMDLPGELRKIHGSRDYFQIECEDVLLEIVPVVKNRNPELAGNVTDVSLRHVKYVARKIREKPELADEIKLAKMFCWANGVYGAESYIRGFSGYALEVLVIFYGSFLKFLKNVRKKRVVDPMRYFKSEREVLSEINSSKLDSPIVLIDPTYKYRNVTAGLGYESFERFCNVVRKFLKKPSLDFFEFRGVDIDEMKAFCASGYGCSGYQSMGKKRFIEVDLSTDRQEGSVAGAKMKKIFDFFVRELKRNGQKVLRKEFDYLGVGKMAKGYLVVREIGEIEKKGPSVNMKEAIDGFLKANKGQKVLRKKGFWWIRKKVSVEGILEEVKKVEGEMGAKIISMK